MRLKKYKMFLESRESDMWNIIPKSVKDLHKLFQASGKKLYLVGGSVRDFLTKDKPKDFDLATDALPDEVLDIVDGKYRTNLQGKAFGVVVEHQRKENEKELIGKIKTRFLDELKYAAERCKYCCTHFTKKKKTVTTKAFKAFK